MVINQIIGDHRNKIAKLIMCGLLEFDGHRAELLDIRRWVNRYPDLRMAQRCFEVPKFFQRRPRLCGLLVAIQIDATILMKHKNVIIPLIWLQCL